MSENKGESINSEDEGEKPVDDLRESIKDILKKDEELLAQERVADVQNNIPEDPEKLKELERSIFNGFRVRTSNALRGHWTFGKNEMKGDEEILDSLGKLLMTTPEQLLQRPGFGKTCLKDVRCQLAKKGFLLREDDIDSIKKDYPDFTL